MATDLDGRTVKPGIHYSTGDKLRFAPASAMSKYDILVGTGYANGYMKLSKADADALVSSTSKLYMNLSNVDAGSDSGRGLATPWCVVTDVNTNGASVGDPVYLSGTAGGWSLTPGSKARVIGRVLKVSATEGAFLFDGSIGSDYGVLLAAGTDTIAAGQSSKAVLTGRTDLDGAPAFAIVRQAVADGTLTHIVRAAWNGTGTLTVYGNGNATANTSIAYFVYARG